LKGKKKEVTFDAYGKMIEKPASEEKD